MPITRRGFTLLELLIVVGVIAILVGLALAIGRSVSGRGKEVKTQELIKVLDTSMTEFVAASGAIPQKMVVDPRRTGPNTNGNWLQPVADAYSPDTPGGMINSVGLYMLQCDSQPSVASLFKNLDAKFMRELDSDGTGPDAWDPFPTLRTVFDGWDRPIRYVHPASDGLVYGPWPNSSDPNAPVNTDDVYDPPPPGKFYRVAQLRRNNEQGGDSDGGVCRGGQPYFYSAGPDGDPSTTADNVYTTKPEIEKN